MLVKKATVVAPINYIICITCKISNFLIDFRNRKCYGVGLTGFEQPVMQALQKLFAGNLTPIS